jgi:hypothetical protein
MENSKKNNPGESIIKWINSPKRDFNTGMNLLRKSGYKPHVFKHLEGMGAGDPRAHRILNTELRNCLRDGRKAAREAHAAAQEGERETQDPEEKFAGTSNGELQKEYPGIIKKTLTEFRSLYRSRSILHGELKAVGEQNDEKPVNERKHKLITIDAISRRMDILWGIFDRYKTDGSLPEESFFEAPFDPEKETAEGQPVPGYAESVLPADSDELKRLGENLRIRISKAENRLENRSEKKEKKPKPMPESPKRAEILKKIEEMKKQKEAAEYNIVELK